MQQTVTVLTRPVPSLSSYLKSLFIHRSSCPARVLLLPDCWYSTVIVFPLILGFLGGTIVRPWIWYFMHGLNVRPRPSNCCGSRPRHQLGLCAELGVASRLGYADTQAWIMSLTATGFCCKVPSRHWNLAAKMLNAFSTTLLAQLMRQLNIRSDLLRFFLE